MLHPSFLGNILNLYQHHYNLAITITFFIDLNFLISILAWLNPLQTRLMLNYRAKATFNAYGSNIPNSCIKLSQ